jgi:hypothetical protein
MIIDNISGSPKAGKIVLPSTRVISSAKLWTLVIGVMAAILGIADIVSFWINNTYFLHPYFALMIAVGGLFLVLTIAVDINNRT